MTLSEQQKIAASGRLAENGLALKQAIAKSCPVYSDHEQATNGQVVEFLNIWGMTADSPETWKKLMDWITDRVRETGCDHIFCFESRGFALGSVVSYLS